MGTLFKPVRGLESEILRSNPIDGYVWFATDTKKIYYSNGESFLSMGGNSSIFYGNKDTSDADENQKIFDFLFSDFEQQDKPNINDLILNSDGCFYRVTDINLNSVNAYKLTVAGSGGSGSSGSDIPSGPNLSEAKISYIGNNDLISLSGHSCLLKFNAIAKDRAGDETIGGTVQWYIDGRYKEQSRFKNGNNEFDIGPYLLSGTNSITGYFYINIGTSTPVELTKTWAVEVVNTKLIWDYDFSTIQKNDLITLNYTILGNNKLQKTLYVNIDNKYDKVISVSSDREQQLVLNREEYELAHGIHTISMYAKIKISSDFIYETDKIERKIMCVDEDAENAAILILIESSEIEVTQYDTKEIPIMIYNPNSSNSIVVLQENGETCATWNDIENEKIYNWLFTPQNDGVYILTVSCGAESVNILANIEKLSIDAQEPTNYEINFKASQFSGNNELKNNSLLSFSDNFDWVNGGLQQEILDDGTSRQYICVKAGTEMSINYPLFKDFRDGKAIKIIFKIAQCGNYDATAIRCFATGTSQGLRIKAQNAVYYTSATSTLTQYCEGSYIEYEIDVDKANGRIISWMNGVPTGVTLFSKDTTLNQFTEEPIIVGSPDCDVYFYLLKSYNRHLTDNQHLDNFILDAYNAKEILKRYNRNNILNDDNEIDYKKVIQQNPDCYVQLYDVPRMTTAKKDKVSINSFAIYKEDPSNFIFAAENTAAETAAGKGAIIKVQGTSSEAYGVSAFNMDLDLSKKKITLPDRSQVSLVSFDDENEVPINYFNTKVNVASCESANNAINAEWYNKYQPYTCKAKKTNEKRRDTMKFRPCVVFIKDNNSETRLKDVDGNSVFIKSQGVVENIFKDKNNTPITDRYQMYAVGNIGNSKNNYDVFHDKNNPLELCIEVTDNQDPSQWMTKANGMYFEKINGKETRVYKDLTLEGIESTENFNLWLNNLDDVDFAVRYVTKTIEDANTGLKTYSATKDLKDDDGNLNVSIDQIKNFFNLVQWFAKNDVNEYDQVNHPYGYTNNLFTESNHPEDAVFEDGKWVVHYDDGYTFKLKDWKGDNTVLGGLTITDYQTGIASRPYYDADTYEYRMAKMLSTCEEHLIMDSVVYHYLFIERHCMVDNVAKNTFWSTEDGQHWNMVKDYDNDTADGNDNSGHMTLNYGIEALDKDPKTDIPYFNGYDAVWLHFVHGLYDARRKMYQNRSDAGAWNAESYLKAFEDFQDCIPERCWIEDYYRKYIRPYDIYNDDSYLTRLEGGKKTEQRRQYENYQSYYMGTLYQTGDYVNRSTAIMIRGNAKVDNVEDISIPVKVYSDCYLITQWGQTIKTFKAKRNQIINIIPAHSNMTDETIYWYTPSLYTSIGDIGVLKPKIITLGGAVRLTDFQLGNNETENSELSAITFSNNKLLKKLSVINCIGLGVFNDGELEMNVDGTYLDLSQLTSLSELNLSLSKFTNVILPSGAPLTNIKLNAIKELTMSSLKQINQFDMDSYDKLETVYINDSDYTDGFNTHDLITKASNLQRYYLKNIQWNLKNEDDVNASEWKVYAIDSLLNKQPYDKVNSKMISSSEALTGLVYIRQNVYAGSDGIKFYDNYVQDDKYSNLDFDFEDEQTKLYHIKVLNGDGSVAFKKVVTSSAVIDKNFFNDLKINAIKKASTTQWVYTFDNKWKMQDNTIIESEKPYYLGTLNQDLTFTPIFNQTLATYSIDFFYTDSDFNANITNSATKLIKHLDNVPYGTEVSSILPNEVPSLNNNNLTLDRVYGFKGYYYNQAGTAKLNDSYQIASNGIFYAVFEEKSVYENVIDFKYIDFVEGTYTPQLGEFANQTVSGYYIVPKDEYILAGKITLPIQYNNLPVLGIHSVNDLQNRIETEEYTYAGLSGLITGLYYKTGTFGRQKITHIFWEPESESKKLQVYEIGDYAFGRHTNDDTAMYRATLKYFEPAKTIEHFGEYAFYKQTRLELNTLPENLIKISDYACAMLCYTRLCQIGNHVKHIGQYAFLGDTYGKDESLLIGDSVEYIGQGAFSHYGWYGSVREPDYLEVVQSGTRKDFTTVFIGSGIRTIGSEVFASRNSDDANINTIKDIYISSDEANVNNNINDPVQQAGKISYENNKWGATFATIHWNDGNREEN